MSLNARWILGLVGLLLVQCAGVLTAEDEKPKKAAAVKEQPAKAESKAEAKTEADPKKPVAKKDAFTIPAGALPDELMSVLEGLMEKIETIPTQEGRVTYITKLVPVMLEVTDSILSNKKADDEVALKALAIRFEALDVKGQLGDEGAEKVSLELAKKYSTDPRKKLAKMAQEKLLFANLQKIKELKENEQEALVDDAVAFVKSSGKFSRRSIQMAQIIGRMIESTGRESLAAKAYEQFAMVFAHAGDEQGELVGKKFTAMAERFKLVGKPLEIEGDLVDGKPIDWAAYKGKVVLIDFWATWCGPCVAELPNIKKNYAGYHSKGFDVVGVSLDDSKRDLERFIAVHQVPWAIMFSTDEKAAGLDHPLATKYGVMGIPVTILVGKDGNVIKMPAQGEALGEALEKLLGEPDKAAVAAFEAEEKAREKKANSEDEDEPKGTEKKSKESKE